MFTNSTPVEYKEAIGILADTSQHVDLIAAEIKSQVLPKIKNKQSLLDVGAGAGILTKQFRHDFENITVVELNPELKQELENNDFIVNICDFFDFKTNQTYDLVLCSHVMYHYDVKQMERFIDKLLSLVSPGGYCFIALMAAHGQNHQFHIEFNPHYVSSQQIIDILEKRKYSFDKITVKNHFTATSQSSMKNLLKFFAIEDCLSKPSSALTQTEMKQIDDTVNRQADECNTDGKWVLEQEEDYIFVPRKK